MPKEVMYDVKISATDLARLTPTQLIATPAGRQTLLEYLTRPNGGFWALEPMTDEAIPANCKGSYALGTACGKCTRCELARREVFRTTVNFAVMPTHEQVVQYYADQPRPQTYALLVKSVDGARHRHSGMSNTHTHIADGVVHFAEVDGKTWHSYVIQNITGWSLEPNKEEAKK